MAATTKLALAGRKLAGCIDMDSGRNTLKNRQGKTDTVIIVLLVLRATVIQVAGSTVVSFSMIDCACSTGGACFLTLLVVFFPLSLRITSRSYWLVPEPVERELSSWLLLVAWRG